MSHPVRLSTCRHARRDIHRHTQRHTQDIHRDIHRDIHKPATKHHEQLSTPFNNEFFLHDFSRQSPPQFHATAPHYTYLHKIYSQARNSSIVRDVRHLKACSVHRNSFTTLCKPLHEQGVLISVPLDHEKAPLVKSALKDSEDVLSNLSCCVAIRTTGSINFFLVIYYCTPEFTIEKNPTFIGSCMDITRLGGQRVFNDFDHAVGCVFRSHRLC